MNKIFLLLMMLCSFTVRAQDLAQEQQQTSSAQTEQQTAPRQAAENTAQSNAATIGEASINLRTTVTGNQEQPRVMYILPWQSPLSPELEMEMLGSEADSVFGHLERDELQRHLEAAGELDAEE
ncbi:hypothetical protein CBP51_12845 [Cellvibrio mixtus]|uniref:Uncharacterized protein n=1 Tax=Cellvibrio mixtus TaxID=39650 RepID=A0A266QD50_9GAMM|nr:hypothetical protein [Cellvibrio mixtus]OZY87803.1 hypothetical protein CBP51_12845 [Cellvibrio mixtus]